MESTSFEGQGETTHDQKKKRDHQQQQAGPTRNAEPEPEPEPTNPTSVREAHLSGLAEAGDSREQLEVAVTGRVRHAVRHVAAKAITAREHTRRVRAEKALTK